MPTRIEWVRNPDGSPGETWNPVIGCSHCSPGCDNCYAERMAARLAKMPRAPHEYSEIIGPDRRWNGETRVVGTRVMEKPLHWKKPRTILLCSMSDLFHEHVWDSTLEQILKIQHRTPQHRYLWLTKRPARMEYFLRCATALPGLGWPWKNLWVGVTVCNQAEADAKIPILLKTPAAVRYVSIEPCLGPVDVSPYLGSGKVSWVILGGETGPGARPLHPDWARGVRDQCAAVGVPFFFKQWGDIAPCTNAYHNGPYWLIEEGEEGDVLPELAEKRYLGNTTMARVGKKRAGHLLDGCEHREFPKETP